MSIKYPAASSGLQFYVPQTLAADFRNFLNYDIPNTNMDFIIYKDWYDQFKEDYVQKKIRGQLYPDSTKSRYSNTDNNLNIRTDVQSGIRKGDILKDQNGVIYVLDWSVTLQHNNAPSRALKCNTKLKAKRYTRQVTDADGYLIQQQGWTTIVDDTPCNMYRYDGRPEYAAAAGSAGISPNALTICTVQYNSQTKNLKIDDIFTWGEQEYIIIDINRIGLDMQQKYGTITIQAKKNPGGHP